MGGTKSVSLQHWLLWFGEASDKIKHIVEEFAEWLIDKRPPWSAYCMLMWGYLIVLDKHPGVYPVGVEGTWRQLMEKIVLKLAVHKAKEAYRNYQLCGEMDAEIEEVIHVMWTLWHKNAQKENWCVSSLTRATSLIRRIVWQCCGPSDMNVPGARSLTSTVIATVPPWGCADWMGQATSFTARSTWPREISSPWLITAFRFSRSYTRPAPRTPRLRSHGAWMTLAQGAHLQPYRHTWGTWRQGSPCGATFLSQPRASQSYH